jgi:hypothetical protein
MFVERILKVEPFPWQKAALEAVGKHDRVAIKSGHGIGKTAFLSWVVLWYLTTHYPCKIPFTANSQDQLRDVNWAELSVWIKRLPEFIRNEIDLTTERIALKSDPGGSFCAARTASKERPEAMQGFHSPHLLFIVEEASGIDDIVFEVAQGALSTPGAKIVMVGNPTRPNGFFFRAFTSQRDRWFTMTISSEEVPQARGHIEDIISQYGRDSNAYRVRVLGEFPKVDDDSVISLDLLEKAMGRKVEIRSVRPVWGIDVARYGSDATALAKRKGNILLEPVKFWRAKSLMQTVGLIVREYEADHDKPSDILVDVIGIGAGVVDRLRELELPVRGINVAESAANDEQYMRLRDELWWKARSWLEALDCNIPDDRKLIAELTSVHYEVLSSGKIKVESKDDLKARGLQSPDLADAFCLTFANGRDKWIENRKMDRYRQRLRPKNRLLTWMAS